MLLVEQTLENQIYMIQMEQILKNPDLLTEDLKEKLAGWTKNKFASFQKKVISAAKKKDMKTLKAMRSVVPSMGLKDIEDLGHKASSQFASLSSTAEKKLVSISKGKVSRNRIKALSLMFALSAATDKKPKDKLNSLLKNAQDEAEEIEITPVDLLRWVVSLALATAATFAIAATTGILFIFGPLLFFGIFNALLIAIFGGTD